MRATRAGALLVVGLLLTTEARAISPAAGDRRDSRRFSLNKFEKKRRKAPSAASRNAFAVFNRSEGGGWKMRFDPRTGRPSSLVGGKTRRRPGGPERAAAAFLSESRDLLGVDPDQLSVEKESAGEGHRHLLYHQTYRGLPVEFSRVKVHLDDQGSVNGFHSNFEPISNLDIRPRLSAAEAAAVVESDLGRPPRDEGELVVFPSEDDGKPHLAWKFDAAGREGRFKYYVDAVDGKLLFRYNSLRSAVCLTSGVVTGLVYDLDPVQDVTPKVRPFNHQRVYIVDNNTFAETGGVAPFNPETTASGGQGFFCGAATGKIFTQLQGPFVSVSSFRGPSAHYDNAHGVWSTIATPISSPHPYANSTVVTSTINLASIAPTAVKFLPIFTTFHVGEILAGQFGEALDFADNDDVEVVDGFGNAVSAYIGDRGGFHAAAVPGKLMRIRLRANKTGPATGYDVALSSYLVLPSASQHVFASFTWNPASHTATGLRSELNLFYHLNQMHDFFVGGVDRSSAAYLGGSIAAMAFAGPGLINAFYDPELDRLFFGDVNDAVPQDIITDDATVPRHEFTHYVTEKIWPIQNFGQSGAISEANADYFSASSLNDPRIGLYFNQSLGALGPLRELDCAANPPCRILTSGSWLSEIHDDSIYVSQALWDIRKQRIVDQSSAVNGAKCADGLVFQSLLYFPESFQELLDAMLRVDALGAVPDCGLGACGGIAAGCAGATINAAFAAHGLPLPGGTSDIWDQVGGRHNDGFETAVDITTFPSVSATIFPEADQDFFTFGAGPGRVKIVMSLPPDNGFYKGYEMRLFDNTRQPVAVGAPPYDGFNTNDGSCEVLDCNTSQPVATLEYENPAATQFFLQVTGGPTTDGSNSAVNSTLPYSFIVNWEQRRAVAGSIVTASFDRDTISYSVNTTTFPQRQDFYFGYAQLRDQAQQVIAQTDTRFPVFLTLISSVNAHGAITGTVRLSPGFADRYPAIGTVYLEVFGYNVVGSTASLGLSGAINLTTDRTEVKAWNNVFNPARGEKTTIKYDVTKPGRLTMRLYTMAGELIGTLFDGEVPAGKGTLDWFGRNGSGNIVASGIYLLQVQGPDLSEIKKIAVVK